jgi:hypothetical protein
MEGSRRHGGRDVEITRRQLWNYSIVT